jgi:hypothetical protein
MFDNIGTFFLCTARLDGGCVLYEALWGSNRHNDDDDDVYCGTGKMGAGASRGWARNASGRC